MAWSRQSYKARELEEDKEEPKKKKGKHGVELEENMIGKMSEEEKEGMNVIKNISDDAAIQRKLERSRLMSQNVTELKASP